MGEWKIGKYYVKHIIDPRRWLMVIDSWIAKRYVSAAYCEQITLRLNTEPCKSQCVSKGACEHCGCKLPDSMLVRENQCSDGHWGKVMSDEDWNKFKEETGLKIVVKYG